MAGKGMIHEVERPQSREMEEGGQRTSRDRRRIGSTQQPPLIRQNPFPTRTTCNEEYRGYINFPETKPFRENIEDLNSNRMWKEYISKRCPLLIDGLIEDDEWQGEKWKDLDYIRSIAGSTKVKIEPVDPISNHFGSGSKRKIVALKEFLDILQDENQAGKWYMTTQYLEDDEDDEEEEDGEEDEDSQSSTGSESFESRKNGHSPTSTTISSSTTMNQIQDNPIQAKDIDKEGLPIVDLDFSLPPPTDALSHLFPLPTPSLMGGLVLQQCNLWLGNGTSGKSSGLHHDFHDNLYMVLSGRKRFLIWPPVAHRWLEPIGDIFRVHSNGLIEYDLPNEPVLRADGLSKAEAVEWRIRARKRALNEADERAARQSGEGKVTKSLRKGKQKQTKEQEDAMELLRQAELQKILLTLKDIENQVNGSDSSGSYSQEQDIFSADQDSDSDEDSDEEIESDYDEEDDYDDEEGEDEEENLPEKKQETRYGQLRSLLAGNPVEEDEEDDSFSEQSSSVESQNSSPQQKNGKRRKRAESILRIPSGGLPGGLRGSLRDPDGRYDSDISGDMSDEDDFIMAAMEDGGDIGQGEIFTVPMIPEIEGELSEEEGDEIRVELVQEEEESLSDNNIVKEDSEEIEMKQKDATSLSSNSNHDESDYLKNYEDGSEDEEESDSDSVDWEGAVEDGEALLDQLAKLDKTQTNGRGTNDDFTDTLTQEEEEEPQSFSKIQPQAMHWFFDKVDDPADPHATISEDPPRIPGGPTLVPRENCPMPIEIHLGPGQMLYLPASWYHEVTSYCEKPKEGGNEVHMALNYWFHPPTAVNERSGLPKRLRVPLGLDGLPDREAITSTLKKPNASATGSKSANAEVNIPCAQHPYLDREIWDEIRITVQKKTDKVRKKALEKAIRLGQNNVSALSGNGKRKAETVLTAEPQLDGQSDSMDSSTKRQRNMKEDEE